MLPLKDNIPLARFPIVTVALVAIDVVAYLLAIRHGGSFLGGPSTAQAHRYGATPDRLTHSGTLATWKTALSSMFVHAGFLQIFANMLFLALFGPTVEGALGRLRFLAFFLLGGLVALGVQVLVEPHSMAPALGASGAIAAVLGGYVVLHPRARFVSLVPLIFFVTIVEVPAVILLGVWFAEQLYVALAGLASPVAGGEGLAYLAQCAGFVFGLLAIRLFARRRSGDAPLAVF
jgi:membrane associated rhomboid family serine protease